MERKDDDINTRLKKVEEKVERIEKLLKGKTFARFKYINSLYKYVKDIYARLELKKDKE